MSDNSASGSGVANYCRSNLFPLSADGMIVAASGSGGNCDCVIEDSGTNFADDDSCGAGFAYITPGVDFSTILADNGGPTQTHALFPRSVAIDATGECGLDTDQRGIPRDDGWCDSGSFEFRPEWRHRTRFGTDH